ncbi:MAG: anti-sigma factor antagonist [Oscillospiraceae bacterium]|nr:anti-sigma factor antagonist [Oscillospiraceae bacterium]
MPVECMCREREMTVTLSGELDHHGAKQIMANLDSRIDLELPRRLTVDMSGITFTDSSGIAVLLRAQRRMMQLDGSMTVINVPVQADRVFRAAGLHRIIRFE